MDTKNIKVAFVTDDGVTISAHFGRARFYEVVQVENGMVTRRERREKAGHHSFAQEGEAHHHDGRHGFDTQSQAKHTAMLAPVMDCQMVVARGMGAGAYQHITGSNITAVVTDNRDIEKALNQIVSETIINHVGRLH